MAETCHDRRMPTERVYTHTSTSEDEEEEDDGFDFVVKRKIDDERVHRIFVRCDTTLVVGGVGDDQDLLAETKREKREREKDIPREPRWS